MNRLKSKASFTLIEIMVVLLILAILAGLTYPVIIAARSHARKKQAEAEIVMIQEALKKYLSVYRKWPAVKATTEDSVFTNDNNEIIQPLIDPDENPRNRIFLSIQTNAIDEHGNMVDPWGNPYRICIDTDYDGLVLGYRENDFVNNPIKKDGYYSVYCGWIR